MDTLSAGQKVRNRKPIYIRQDDTRTACSWQTDLSAEHAPHAPLMLHQQVWHDELTRSVALELAGNGVRVNAICPEDTEKTPMDQNRSCRQRRRRLGGRPDADKIKVQFLWNRPSQSCVISHVGRPVTTYDSLPCGEGRIS
ncbi:MAG: hypothetical protein ACKVJG_02490 [Candidatus Latescibacterota bacterium]|jgi:hypothetical protein